MRRPVITLTGLGLVLAAAFVSVPGPLAAAGSDGGLAGHARLVEAVHGGFVTYWRTEERGGQLDRVVDYWWRYHMVKGAIAALLLAVLVALGVRLARAAARPGRQVGAAAGAVAVAGFGLVALASVMANVQGAVAPFASLLPMLGEGAADPALDGALAQVRQGLAAGGQEPPALRAMVADFGLYHEAMVVIAALVGLVLATAGVWLWRRFAGAAERPARLVLGCAGLLAGILTVLAVALVVANAGVAADPAPALLALFEGGW